MLFLATGVLAYTTFQWGGVVRAGRYQYLLVLGLLAILVSFNRTPDAWPPPSPSDKLLRWAAALLPAYVLLQVLPLPIAALRVLSPARAEAIDALGPVGAKLHFASLSVFPAGTFQYFLLVCGYLVIFLLARSLTWRFRDRRWLVTWPILGIAAFEAALGVWQHAGGLEGPFRWGTYANYNHYAGFLEMALPFAVMYPMAILHRARSGWHRSLAHALRVSSVWALALLLFVGIILSFSRMGFIATLSSLFLMGALLLGTTQLGWFTASRKRRWVGIGILAALVLAGFVLLPPQKLIQRFAEFISTDGLSSEGRTDLWVETLPLIKASPLFGCGLGGYETAFSRFKVSGVLVTDDFAHNDYLQLLAELGVVGFAIGATLAFSVVRIALRHARKFADAEARYLAVASLGALVAIALHSLADFNLYIPANAMLLAWIAGMTMSLGVREISGSMPERFGQRNVDADEAAEIGLHAQTYV